MQGVFMLCNVLMTPFSVNLLYYIPTSVHTDRFSPWRHNLMLFIMM